MPSNKFREMHTWDFIQAPRAVIQDLMDLMVAPGVITPIIYMLLKQSMVKVKSLHLAHQCLCRLEQDVKLATFYSKL